MAARQTVLLDRLAILMRGAARNTTMHLQRTDPFVAIRNDAGRKENMETKKAAFCSISKEALVLSSPDSEIVKLYSQSDNQEQYIFHSGFPGVALGGNGLKNVRFRFQQISNSAFRLARGLGVFATFRQSKNRIYACSLPLFSSCSCHCQFLLDSQPNFLSTAPSR
jgi:hypothetical protein